MSGRQNGEEEGEMKRKELKDMGNRKEMRGRR